MVDIISSKVITLLSTPANANVTRMLERKNVRLTCSKADDELKVYYRCTDMRSPTLIYGINPKNADEIAALISMVPTFEEEPGLNNELEILSDVEP